MKKLFFISFLLLFIIGACKEGIVEPIPTPPPFIKKFQINPDSLVVVSGNPIEITWEVDNAVNVETNFGASSTTGKIVIYPIETTVFYITGINSSGDKKTEQKKVTISPQIKVGMFHQGGVVVSLEDKLICSTRDLSPSDWWKAVKNCEDLIENGYSDWKLPNMSQLGIIWKEQLKIPGLLQYYVSSDPERNDYWSSDEGRDQRWAQLLDWEHGLKPDFYVWGLKVDKYFVRPVRTY